jgi:hypothetical protein
LTPVVEVSFAPALDPSARALTLEFPSPFDDESVILDNRALEVRRFCMIVDE